MESARVKWEKAEFLSVDYVRFVAFVVTEVIA